MYYADIITKDDDFGTVSAGAEDNSPVVRALFNNIKSCKHAVTQSLTAKPRDVHEVVIYRRYENQNNKIHGYYEWTGDKLKLKRDVEPFVHNVMYGRV